MPSEFANVIVKTGSAGEITRVATSAASSSARRPTARCSRSTASPSAGLAIFQSPGANALNVGNEVEQADAASCRASFRRALTYGIPFDTTKFVRASINEVYKTLFEAGILVLIVILFFLQDWRAMLVPGDHRAGHHHRRVRRHGGAGLHRQSLDAVRASCWRSASWSTTPSSWSKAPPTTSSRACRGHDAAIRAMDQLFGPIIGITLVLMAVFMPAAFLPGLTGRMYAQFALVIAATALLSAINAATLKPTQCAMWLRPTGAAGKAQHRLSRLQPCLRSVPSAAIRG